MTLQTFTSPLITQNRPFPYRIAETVDYTDISLTVASDKDHSSALTVEKLATKPPTALNDDATKQGTIQTYNFALSVVKQVT